MMIFEMYAPSFIAGASLPFLLSITEGRKSLGELLCFVVLVLPAGWAVYSAGFKYIDRLADPYYDWKMAGIFLASALVSVFAMCFAMAVYHTAIQLRK